MISEAAFLTAIKADPNDNLTRLAFADWLDEQGRLGGKLLRLDCALSEIDPKDGDRAGLIDQFRLACRGLDPEWIAVVTRVTIEGDKTGIRCEFCHKYIPDRDYPAHQAMHLELLPDGQQEDYASLPPEERDHGSLESVPRVYVHLVCGGGTIMQEKCIRSYLKDPFMYDDSVFCTGCGQHPPNREFVWQETGENLQTYMDRLRAQASPGLGGFLRRTLRRIRQWLG